LAPTHGGVTVYSDHLEGYAWAENIGWIRLGTSGRGDQYYDNTSAADYGVNNDGSGNLSGYAWGENVGWIHFDGPYRLVTTYYHTAVEDVLFQPRQGAHVCICCKSVLYCGRC
jgi:hypothetical protein